MGLNPRGYAAMSDPNENAEYFNEDIPIGTSVHYYPIAGRPEFVVTKTRSKAWVMGGHHAVVLIEGRTGGVSCAHVELIPALTLNELSDALEKVFTSGPVD